MDNSTLKTPTLNDTHMGRSKVDLYKWKTVIDRKGEMAYVDKHLLTIDEAYQRNEVSPSRVSLVASEFLWVAFGVLVVARRGSKLCVMDGQHRLLAAMKRSDITSVPCIIFDGLALQDEAGAFISLNTVCGAMKRYDRFRAELIANNQEAIAVRDVLSRHGYSVKGVAGDGVKIKCVAAIASAMKNCGISAERAVQLIADIAPGAPFDDVVFSGLAYLDDHCRKNNIDLLNRQNRTQLQSLGYEKLKEASQKAAAFYSRGGAKVWATGITEVLNKRRSSNRIPSPQLEQ